MSDIFCEHVAAMYGIATESTAPRRISVLELSGGVTLRYGKIVRHESDLNHL